MYLPTVGKMLIKHNDAVLVFDPETLRIWEGDSDTETILVLLDKGTQIPHIAGRLNRSVSSLSDEVEDMRQKGILGKSEKGKGSSIFSVTPLFHGIFELPFPLEVLRERAAYLARLSKEEGENEAVLTARMSSTCNPDELDSLREILDDVSARTHTDLLFSLFTYPQHVEHVLDTRIDHVTIEVNRSSLPLLKSLDLDRDMVSVRIAQEDLEDTRNTVSELENMGLINFEIPYAYTDVHIAFLEKVSFENFSDVPLSDKLIDILVTILSRRPVSEPHCGAGVKTFFCNPEGEIYPCHDAQAEQFSMKMNLTHQDHRDSPLSRRLRGRTQEACAACWTRNLCGGGCFLHHENCAEFQLLVQHTVSRYPDIMGDMKKKIAESTGADRLELIVTVLERIRQNYIFSWCRLR